MFKPGKNAPRKRKVSKETRRRLSISHIGINKGKKHFAWKGEDAGYSAKHDWINRNYGKARKCEKCGLKKAKRYEWANLSGRYKRDIKDYIQLCCSCHRKFDYTDEMRKKTSDRMKGNIPWNKGRKTIKQIYTKRCKECGKEYNTTNNKRILCSRTCSAKRNGRFIKRYLSIQSVSDNQLLKELKLRKLI